MQEEEYAKHGIRNSIGIDTSVLNNVVLDGGDLDDKYWDLDKNEMFDDGEARSSENNTDKKTIRKIPFLHSLLTSRYFL